MANLKDKLIDRIPAHILSDYPRFFDFLEAYYEWLSKDDNPYGAIKNHMDYLSFAKSIDSYVDFMKREYLVDVPDRVLVDKKMFIKWSKQFNLARGSHASYKFLFRLLFNEQNTSIYLPKENILRTSDGRWVSGESLIMVTHSADNLEQFQFQRIFQERVVFGDIVERATAEVQRVRTKYAGRYVVTELAVANVVGEFLPDHPIQSATGASEWPIPTISRVVVTEPGTGYQRGERILTESMDFLDVERQADQVGYFDTRVTTLFSIADISVYVNGNQITDFDFNGREVTSSLIGINDWVTVSLPSYQGYIAVDSTGDLGSVTSIEVLDLPIATLNTYSIVSDGLGTGIEGFTESGMTKELKGYYINTRGFLSSNMYLQDSFFYQEYSYAIRTSQDFTAYADVVKDLLHPAGFLMFGQLNIFDTIELLLTYEDPLEIEILPFSVENLHKYGLGANHSFFDRFKDGVSKRLYRIGNFDRLDMEMVAGQEGYKLEDDFLRRVGSYNYPGTKGWMTKSNFADYYLYISQDYTEGQDSGLEYFETGYTSDITV